ncbi:MAG TPA: hypothetical protein VHX13_05595 [Acidobacteriaceae bacterium]|nr:hypothetical protein [Acidobacteriaceae bacterium]
MAETSSGQRTRDGETPARRRGSTRLEWALGCALAVLGLVLWLTLRPSGEPPWNDKAIAADFQTLTIQKPDGPVEAGQTPGDVHVVFRYRLRNSTARTYRVPEPKSGVLMKSVAGGGWQEVDSVLWDNHLSIPARKTADVEFDMAIPSTDPGAPEELSEQKDLAAAAMARLQSIENLTFFDYEHHYVIHLPRGWE